MLFFPLINLKMPTIVGILTFMSRKNYILSRAEHKKSFITSGPGLTSHQQQGHKEKGPPFKVSSERMRSGGSTL